MWGHVRALDSDLLGGAVVDRGRDVQDDPAAERGHSTRIVPPRFTVEKTHV